MSDDIDPEVKREAQNELEAVRAGHEPLNDELNEGLGRLSLAASKIEDAQTQAEADRANLEFLKKFAQLLPQADLDFPSYLSKFNLDGKDAQYTARQIQANSLWVHGMHHTAPTAAPWFIIGRQIDISEDNAVNLLLLRAPGSYPDHLSGIMSVSVRKDDLEFRDGLLAGIQDDEFTDHEIREMVDRTNSKLVLGSRVKGNFNLTGTYYGEPNAERILNHGIREKESRREEPQRTHFDNDVPVSVIRQLHVSTTMAKLASAFRMEDEYKQLLENKDVREIGGKNTEEALKRQNEELRKALRETMLATGVISRGEADELLEKKYPRI